MERSRQAAVTQAQWQIIARAPTQFPACREWHVRHVPLANSRTRSRYCCIT